MSDTDIQLAVANDTANARINANSANKMLYIVRVEDPSSSQKVKSFAALKIVESGMTLEVVGFEIPDNKNKNSKQKTLNKLNNYQEALEIAEKGNVNVINIKFPWQRIISIQNVNYQRKH